MKASRMAVVGGASAAILTAGFAAAPEPVSSADFLASPDDVDDTDVAQPEPEETEATASTPEPEDTHAEDPDDDDDDDHDDDGYDDDDDDHDDDDDDSEPVANEPEPQPKEPEPEQPAPEEPADSGARSVTGPVVNNSRGDFQVRLQIEGSTVVGVDFLAAGTSASESVRVNSMALPILEERILAAQSADVEFVSGASFTSPGILESARGAFADAGL